MSGAQRLPNGNTLVSAGAVGVLLEVDTNGSILWRYVNPVTGNGILEQGDPVPGAQGGASNPLFKARRYHPDFAGFDGKDLTPGDYIEASTE